MRTRPESPVQLLRRAITAVIVAVIGRLFMPDSDALVAQIEQMKQRKERLRESQRNHLDAEGGDRGDAHWHLGHPDNCMECHDDRTAKEVLP